MPPRADARGGGMAEMEVNALAQSSSARALRNEAYERAGDIRREALAENRRDASEQGIARADESKARSAEQLAELREAVARVIGANTRLSISRADNSLDFVYRAIDIDTGEVVNEWPQGVFVELVRGVREDVRTDVDAGLMLNHVA